MRRLCWNCQVLSQVLSVTSVFKEKLQKLGKFWKATWDQPAGRMRASGHGLDSDSTVLSYSDIFLTSVIKHVTLFLVGNTMEGFWLKLCIIYYKT